MTFEEVDLHASPRVWRNRVLLEAIYFGRPVMVNRYPVYVADIAPAGLDLIEIDAAITQETVDSVTDWLDDPARRLAAAEQNYKICQENFSYAAVSRFVLPLLTAATG